MTKAKSGAKSPAKAKTKSTSKPTSAPQKAASKLVNAATNVVKALAPKKVASVPAPTPIAKPAVTSIPNAAAPNAPSGHSSWSESLRKAMQEKNSQRHWPENKTDWKDRQRAGLSVTHRNKFG